MGICNLKKRVSNNDEEIRDTRTWIIDQQGDQIGRIFAHFGAIVFFVCFLNYRNTYVAQILYSSSDDLE
jgi:hypothetical protein